MAVMVVTMTKLFIAFLVSLVFSSVAMAGTTASSDSGAVAGAAAGSQSGVSIQSNAPPVDMSRAIGQAYAPALTSSSFITCLGSMSAGAGFMGGAFSIGSTYKDSECNLRQYALLLTTMGDAQVAKAVLCSDEIIVKAFNDVGRPCGVYPKTPEPQPNPSLSAVQPPPTYEPIVLQKWPDLTPKQMAVVEKRMKQHGGL
jgi:hypothetical protein